MADRSRARLQDIVDAAEELAGYLKDQTRAGFMRDRAAQRVTERLLEIAGEAATHVPDDVADGIEVDWAGLQAMRVILAHAYHRIDPDILWTAATSQLPHLAKQLRKHLDRASPSQ